MRERCCTLTRERTFGRSSSVPYRFFPGCRRLQRWAGWRKNPHVRAPSRLLSALSPLANRLFLSSPLAPACCWCVRNPTFLLSPPPFLSLSLPSSPASFAISSSAIAPSGPSAFLALQLLPLFSRPPGFAPFSAPLLLRNRRFRLRLLPALSPLPQFPNSAPRRWASPQLFTILCLPFAACVPLFLVCSSCLLIVAELCEIRRPLESTAWEFVFQCLSRASMNIW